MTTLYPIAFLFLSYNVFSIWKVFYRERVHLKMHLLFYTDMFCIILHTFKNSMTIYHSAKKKILGCVHWCLFRICITSMIISQLTVSNKLSLNVYNEFKCNNLYEYTILCHIKKMYSGEICKFISRLIRWNFLLA